MSDHTIPLYDSNDVLVERARERLRSEDTYALERIRFSEGEAENRMWTYIRVMITAHLKDFKEHGAIKDYDISGASGLMCDYCGSAYPCSFIVSKSKILLGENNE